MADLDFDELDRAVNSLMSSKSKDKSNKPDTLTVEQTATSEDNAVSRGQTPKTEEPQSNTQVQKRSSGQYMDMMPSRPQPQVAALKSHGTTELSSPVLNASPSQNTETPKPVTPFHDIIPPKTGVSTSSLVGENENQVVSQPSSDGAPTVPDTDVQSQLEAALQEKEEQKSDTLPAPEATDTLPKPSGPPLNQAKSSQPDESSVKPDELDSPTSAEVSDTKPSGSLSPTASPFLADAKVEKRPLGGASTPEQDKALQDAGVPNETESKSVDTTVPQVTEGFATGSMLDNKADVQPAPTPPEFHEDLLAVEADQHTSMTNAKPDDSLEQSDQATPAHVGPISITQQYKEKMSTGDQSHTPIYDTNLQPLAHPPQKKSGWSVVIWIIAVIVLCIGIVTALYSTGIL